MKGYLMKELNNKGFGPIPILVLSLIVGTTAIIGYKFYSEESVLQMKTSPVKTIPNPTPITSPSNLPKITATLKYQETGGYQRGKIILEIVSADKNIITYSDLVRKNGLTVEDYCTTAVCPKPRIVRPTVSGSLMEKYVRAEIPVTPSVKKIKLGINSPMEGNDQKLEFKNELEGWSLNGSDFSITRNNQPLNIGVYLKSVNSTNGQQTLEFLINGIGDDTATLIRSIRMVGMRRIDTFEGMSRTVTVRPALSYDGSQGKMTVVAMPGTQTFYFLITSPFSPNFRMQFLPVPSGWTTNKNSDGIDKLNYGLPSRISITEVKTSGGTESTFNFVVKSGKEDMEKIISTIKNKGITVTQCTAEASCFYPVQKPNVVCGDYSTVGCRFSVKVPNAATMVWINYEPGNLVNSVIQSAPRGWRDNTIGTGINKF